MSIHKDGVDFEFFDTPRDEQKVHHVPKVIVKNLPPQPRKNGELRNGNARRNVSDSSDSYSSDSFTDSSGSEDETARSREYVTQHKRDDRNDTKKKSVVTKSYSDSDTKSSSAYSDGSSDEDDSLRKQKKMSSPKQVEQAWTGNGSTNNNNRKELRPKSSKFRSRPTESSNRRSRTDSDSEITDVSPLNSPPSTPTKSKHRDQDQVQYSSTQTQSEDAVQLQSNKIDLKLLMDAVSEIDKQERLKANSRRVMFAPPKTKGGQVQGQSNFNNYKQRDRLSQIEKENQRLLRQIMHHIGPKQKRKPNPENFHPIARIDRLTSSAVNRRREQTKIEEENLKFLSRLQKTKASKGLSRKEQLNDYSKTCLYGVPIAAVHEQMAAEGLNSTYMRSTSSLNSTFGFAQNGRRSRPSSAKSNASSIRPGSAKSTLSVASRASRPGSAKSIRSIDNRPEWNDRFSYS